MTIRRWDPIRELASIQNQMNRLFEDTLRPARGEEEEMPRTAWSPAVDIYQTNSALVIKAELPEIKREDINIKVQDNVLTIEGERKSDHQVKEGDYLRIERQYGAFSRRFSLPSNVDQENIKASFKDGILQIEVPKRPESKTKRIQIK